MVKLLSFLLFFNFSVQSTAAGNTVTLSQKDVAEKVLKESNKAKEAAMTSDLTRLNLLNAQSAFDFGVSYEIDQQIDKQKAWSATGAGNASPINESNSLLNSLKISKPFFTGTTLSLEANNTRITPLPFNTYYLNQFGVTLTQSLWRNFFGISDRATLRAAEKTEESSEYSKLTNLQVVVLDAIKLFWKAYVSQENFKEAIASRERYEKLVEVVKRKSALGYANPGELAQVQAELEGRYQNVKSESTNYLAATDQLNTMLKSPADTEVKFVVPDQVPPMPNFTEVNIENLRAVKAQRAKLEAAQSSLRSSESKNNPDLALTGKLYQNGLAPDATDSNNQLSSGVNPMYFVGIKITQTFGSGSSTEDVRNKRLQRDIEQSKLERLLLETKDQLNDAKRKVQSAYSIANSMKKQKELRELAAQELQKAYNQGRSDISTFITALNNYFNAQVLYSKSVGDYQVALNEYANLRDELVHDYKSEGDK